MARPLAETPAGRRRRRWSGAVKVTLLITLGLLVVDGLIMVADMAHRLNTTRGLFPAFENLQWKSSRDGSHAEVFGYLKLGVAAVLLGALHLVLRPPTSVYLALSAVMALIVIDDAHQLHERWGKHLHLALEIEPRFGLRAQDIGELLVWAGFGAVLGAWLLVSTLRSAPRERRAVRSIALGSALLIISAVLVDMVYIMVRGAIGRRGAYLMRWVEAAGELAGMTVILSIVIWLLFRTRHRPDQARDSGPGPAP